MPILFNIYMKETIVKLQHIYKRRYYVINHCKNKRSSFTDDQVHYNIIKKNNPMFNIPLRKVRALSFCLPQCAERISV